MNKNWIVTRSSTWTDCSLSVAKIIEKEISYTHIDWKYVFGKRQRVSTTVSMLREFEGAYFFPTGLVPRVLQYLKKGKIKYSYSSEITEIEYDEPDVKNIEFREYQNEFIKRAVEQGRGVIHSATGTGKSIIIVGIMSAFSQENILFLVHTQDLVTQMKKDLFKFFNKKEIGEWSGQVREMKRINVATIQSFSKVAEDYSDYFDVVIIDECHHVSSFTGLYAKTLQILEAPVKLGTTATLPYTPEGKIVLESVVGPVLMKYSVNEANDDGILAKPIVKIIPQRPLHPSVLQNRLGFGESVDPVLAAYQRVYYNGIVINKERNLQILEEAYSRTKNGKTVLINVIQLAHIEELVNLSKRYFPELVVEPINSNVKKGERNFIKEKFKKKEILCIAATVSWSEGIDIPSLDCCINAAAGKSEIGVLQKIGRGLRKTAEKNTVEIIDFKDISHVFLQNHYKERLKIYKENGWIE